MIKASNIIDGVSSIIVYVTIIITLPFVFLLVGQPIINKAGDISETIEIQLKGVQYWQDRLDKINQDIMTLENVLESSKNEDSNDDEAFRFVQDKIPPMVNDLIAKRKEIQTRIQTYQ